ncbi:MULTISPECIES: macro domain-containing protein [Bradyrhizobium]|uniref:Thoeris protein ThsA Macro domain-containing protein n=2 Tax=Bradyrhizobium TaxID=374 RepID=A0ABY0PYJ3_9BRAD|nr:MULTISPECIES: macro domain-containing protein [Bradyrhizobium]SDJ16026.1 hypothetical protein SAMN05444163_4707 [Bradyrhizobium ottawaense]SEC86778.1 hypothetical protein SAMN05444171_2455 [Bradyrhizobium lablabi]SHK95942.1 hypothetical protein SAMN05444321_1279 [Bradyrhizobium lablabi]
MLDEVIKSLQVGIARRWQSGLAEALSVAGAIWLITEISTKVSDTAEHWVKDHGNHYSAFVLVTAAIWFIKHVYEVRSVSFNLPTTNTKIEIRYGDLFKEQTGWLIGVGEFFDSAVGQVVSKNSLHGKLIDNVYNGDADRFRGLVDAELVGVKGTRTQRSISPKMKYEIGTTVVLANGAHKVFLVAMSRTHLETHKASSDVPTLWIALRGALESIHNHGNGAPISLPLIGNGQSSVNIDPQHLLRLIVLAIVDYGRKAGLPNQVSIIVPEDCFRVLDIREIRRDWRRR